MPRNGEELLLLDTHVWIWLVGGAPGELSETALGVLRRGSAEGWILISVISVWELAMLVSRGRLRLPLDLDSWVARGLRAPGIRLTDLTPEIAIESTRLPGAMHRDPVDCILIATARLTAARLVTRDARILDYARSGRVATLDAAR